MKRPTNGARAIGLGVLVLAWATIHREAAALVVPAPSVAFSFGSNRDGKSGQGLDDGSTLIATPIVATKLGGRSVAEVAAGFGIEAQSLLLTTSGEVFAFGANDYGKTGIGTNAGNTLMAAPIDMAPLGGRKIVDMAAGWDHSLILADDGSIFAFGLGINGRTGLGVANGVTLSPAPIDPTNIAGKIFVQVSAFGAHSLALTDDGAVYAFGWNSVGQLGVGAVGVDVLIATPIDPTPWAGGKIVQVSAGADHSLLLTDGGTVLAFGSNSDGQTGLGIASGETSTPTPINATNLVGRKIKQVSAGGLHSLLLDDFGAVYSFGTNSLGATGQGTSSGNTLIATPIGAANLAGRVITQVSAGAVHSLLLANDGTVFSFGRNTDGQTGLGTVFASTLVATPIVTTNLTGLRVTRIDAGDAYSLLVAAPIPEPGAGMLGAVGGCFLAAIGRPRRRR
jgi:alpha-tubulin suppressor-like RCC1 family protein